jgi:hypothetical protein
VNTPRIIRITRNISSQFLMKKLMIGAIAEKGNVKAK